MLPVGDTETGETRIRCMYEGMWVCRGGGVKTRLMGGGGERQAVWLEREGGEDGWSAVGGKRGKPQRNKRPSGLIRRQIGCRARRREESERG